LIKENIDYKGFIFIGLIKVNGQPFVIEYNCRLGDPETEAVIPRISSELFDLIEGVAQGNIAGRKIEIDERCAATVMLVSGGYPGDYEKGKSIDGLDLVEEGFVFHAGTKMIDNSIVTSGGRVLALTALGKTKDDALAKSYKAADIAKFDGKYFRKDIGADLNSY
jgi:phosphoribosylamine--glycine ligase